MGIPAVFILDAFGEAIGHLVFPFCSIECRDNWCRSHEIEAHETYPRVIRYDGRWDRVSFQDSPDSVGVCCLCAGPLKTRNVKAIRIVLNSDGGISYQPWWHGEEGWSAICLLPADALEMMSCEALEIEIQWIDPAGGFAWTCNGLANPS